MGRKKDRGAYFSSVCFFPSLPSDGWTWHSYSIFTSLEHHYIQCSVQLTANSELTAQAASSYNQRISVHDHCNMKSDNKIYMSNIYVFQLSEQRLESLAHLTCYVFTYNFVPQSFQSRFCRVSIKNRAKFVFKHFLLPREKDIYC